jgi:hypothetical protein
MNPQIRSTSAIGLPVESTICTASARNCGLNLRRCPGTEQILSVESHCPRSLVHLKLPIPFVLESSETLADAAGRCDRTSVTGSELREQPYAPRSQACVLSSHRGVRGSNPLSSTQIHRSEA